MASTDSGRGSAAPSALSSRRGIFDAAFGAIGSFSVRLRWLVLLVWVMGALAAYSLLPSLSSEGSSATAASAPTTHTSSTSHRNRTLNDPIAPNAASKIPRRDDDAEGAALPRPGSVLAIGVPPLNRDPWPVVVMTTPSFIGGSGAGGQAGCGVTVAGEMVHVASLAMEAPVR